MSLAAFSQEVSSVLPASRRIDDYLNRVAFATDASCYQLIPQLVLRIESTDELIDVLKLAVDHVVPLTFRAAGTSLSGQAISDSVLIILGATWDKLSVKDKGRELALGPGVVGGDANRALKPYGRKIGPDPASINTAKIGGIAANNASGMCCGTRDNAYHTLRSMKLVLANGSFLDTACEESIKRFRTDNAALLATLFELHHDLIKNDSLCDKLRYKYRIKNTTGYGLNALLDFEDPVDILQHLMIGSEGTLGFIAEISLATIPDYEHTAAALWLFKSATEAARAVEMLRAHCVEAAELMDHHCLFSVRDLLPASCRPLIYAGTNEEITGLLIDVRGETEQRLAQKLAQLPSDCKGLLNSPTFSSDPSTYAELWRMRKSILPIIGAGRPVGTTVIIEDVAVPLESLSVAVGELQQLFKRCGYDDAVIFGHALAGNLHIVFTQNFSLKKGVDRYKYLMQSLADLVVGKYQGSMKAEHGTGRNMAPFVRQEWGDDAYGMMSKIKAAFDPAGILNPNVILSDDPEIHLKNLKSLPNTNPLIDRCIECGFCEPTCPSKNLTLSPRQRISVQRQIIRLRDSVAIEDKAALKKLNKDYQYAGIDTCAACGLCSISCPVGINTGDLTRALRAKQNARYSGLARAVVRRIRGLSQLVRPTLHVVSMLAKALGPDRLYRLSRWLNKRSLRVLPLWLPALSIDQRNRPPELIFTVEVSSDPQNRLFIYFPACPNRMMTDALVEGEPLLGMVITDLAKQAGLELLIAPNSENYCCGMTLSSKGFLDLAEESAERYFKHLDLTYPDRSLVIVTDASPCASALKAHQVSGRQVLDVIEFAHDFLLPTLPLKPLNETVMLHVTCSTQVARNAKKMVRIAEACASEVVCPSSVSCCGFAGDKGLFFPELNASALEKLADEVPENCSKGYSSSRTCELGLTHHAGIPYEHLVYLIERAFSNSMCSRSANKAC